MQRQLRITAVALVAMVVALAASEPVLPASIRFGHEDDRPAADDQLAQSGRTVTGATKTGLAKLPVRFEENRGQTDPRVKFVSRGSSHSLFLTAGESVLAAGSTVDSGGSGAVTPVRMRLLGADATARIEGEKRLPGTSNYFYGSDESKWIANVPSYGRVRYRGVYPGVDLVYYGNENGELEYDVVLAPGADPETVALAFDGQRTLSIDPSGDLLLETAGGQLRQRRPVAYQEIGGRRRSVASKYVVNGQHVRFELGRYDKDKPLVIDPVITYSTYLGGSGADEALGAATDGSGGAYITGSTTSIDFPLGSDGALDKECGEDKNCDAAASSLQPNSPLVPNPDVFVSKFSADGSTLEYSTYLGGSGDDRGLGIAVDDGGRAYLTGRTDSSNFPVTNNAFDATCGSDGQCNARLTDDPSDPPTARRTMPDAFVAKLDPKGSTLTYSTYLGGSGDEARAGGTSYYLATGSLDQPGDEAPAFPPATSSSRHHNGPHPGPSGAIAVDDAGNAYVTGVTMSGDFPTSSNAYDPACGSNGTCNREIFDDLACLGSFGGRCRFVRFQPDAFVAKIDTTVAAGEAFRSLVYSTLLGGSGAEAGYGLDFGTDGHALVTGFTSSPKRGQTAPAPFPGSSAPGPYEAFPSTPGAYRSDRPDEVFPGATRSYRVEGAFSEVFVSRIQAGAPPEDALQYSTTIGGRGNGDGSEVRETGFAVAAGPGGTAYVTGQTDGRAANGGADFPVKGSSGKVPFQERQVGDPTQTHFDAFFFQLNTDSDDPNAGNGDPDDLLYSTYLGGERSDSGRGIAVDAEGHAYVAGRANGVPLTGDISVPNTFPTKGAVYSDAQTNNAFVARFDPDGAGQAEDCTEPSCSLVYSTLLGSVRVDPGGEPLTTGNAVAVWTDPMTQLPYAFVAGRTGTSGFPVVGAYQPGNQGGTDAFLTKISPVVPTGPYVTAVEPAEGPSSGGTEVVVTGTALASTTLVEFDGKPAQLIDVNAAGTELRVVTPPGIGLAGVTVTTPAGTSPKSSTARFTFFDGAWTSATDSPTARYGHTATPLPDGRMVMIGGAGAAASTVTVFDPSSGEWRTCGTGPGSSACPDASFGFGHTATLLQGPECRKSPTPAYCGNVLVVFGQIAKLYDPVNDTWAGAGNPNLSRTFHTATLLDGPNCGDNCGKVIMVGGVGGDATRPANDPARTPELFDPSSGTWTRTAPSVDRRVWLHTATLLNGPECSTTPVPSHCSKVLVVGGADRQGNGASDDPESIASAELYDPMAIPPAPEGTEAVPLPVGAWTARRSVISRYGHTATLLSNGKVLIAGGLIGFGGATDGNTGRATGAGEVFDPSKPFDEEQAFTGTGQMLTPRNGHTAVALPDGRALLIGGAGDRPPPPFTGNRPPLSSAEIYDPALPAGKGDWRPAARLAFARGAGPYPGGHTATVVESGPGCGESCTGVLVFGGTKDLRRDFQSGYNPPALTSAELYTPGPSISAIAPMTGPAAGGTTVSIAGSGFAKDRMTDAASVRFGDTPAQSFRVVSPTKIEAVTPAATDADVVDVSVIVSGLGMALGPEKFVYAGLPGKVTDLLATAVSPSEVGLAFSAPGTVEAAGDPATDYVIKQSRSSLNEDNFDAAKSLCDGGVCKFTPTRRGLRLTLAVDGLTPDTAYYYALRAMNGVGQLGPISNVAEVVTGAVAPGVVGDLLATSVGEGKVELSFSAPGSNGVDPPPATRYVVKQSLDPISDERFESAPALCGGFCNLAPAAVGDRLTISVDDLAQGTTYYYRLRAIDAAGNTGPLSNPASATPGCVAATSGTNQVSYPGGYSLVGLPEGAVVPSQTSLYGWFDLGKGGRYSTQEPAQPVVAGRGYWAWFSCPRVVNLPTGGVNSTRSSLGAFRASMVGNPSATRPATVTGHDFAARWDQALNGGVGGYRISAYQAPEVLAVGEGIWAFSYRDTSIQVDAP